MLFHLLSELDWDLARTCGVHTPASLGAEGFVHLSTATQWQRTAARFFAGKQGLLLLEIDPARLRDEVRLEPADGELFPHLYGPLPLDAVHAVHRLAIDERGFRIASTESIG